MAKFVRLSPKRKGKKAAYELRTGKRFTNSGQPKRGKNGKQLTVSKAGRAYRAGYMDARKDIGQAAQAVKQKREKKAVKRVKHDPYSDFDYTPTGRIKGSYTPDGFFESD